ncbi:TPA: hypothetical protein DIV55_06015 [Patescibacteria group bacterium]|uniref:Peptidyl-prolyl cis-trans isomerase n=1 Tax=Candidatus Curtissbacteria bacterium GW2011_GWA1_40_16 TaxID=1618405 RepID=A0A0G0TUH5_9BACT|nr:MAG: Peptidyl-prolyl cis-trans isomerase [Candidatus Curtissbacteria bacterium GW2011_GWA1_40_16]HCS79262.1 hypothetical protein [Patescibacteria group bacterium]
MRNLAILIVGLIFILGLIIFFSLKSNPRQNIFNPSPTPKNLSGTNPANQNQTGSQQSESEFPFPVLEKSQIKGKQVRISTQKGDIVFTLLEEAPFSGSNFIYLTEKGFYNGLTFHKRTETTIEGGDPNGNGTGGPGYTYRDEPVIANYERGVVAMSNAGPNTNGSQFFIMLTNVPDHARTYDIFGYVTEGMDVVDQIQPGDRMTKVTIE